MSDRVTAAPSKRLTIGASHCIPMHLRELWSGVLHKVTHVSGVAGVEGPDRLGNLRI